MIIDGLLPWLTFIGVLVVGLLIRFYVPAYLKKKAENLATKEDIEEVTHKVEGIKYQYSADLESLRASIGSQLYVHQTRYQNEFNILRDLAEKLVELRDAALSLRPVVGSAEANTEEGKKKLMNRYYEAMKDLYQFCETRKPFYPEEIYNGTKKLDQIAWNEYSEYLLSADPKIGIAQYWKTATANAKKISEIANEMMELLRNRVKYWEKFRA